MHRHRDDKHARNDRCTPRERATRNPCESGPGSGRKIRAERARGSLIEQGAGSRANFPDALYKKVEWVGSARRRAGRGADVVLTVQPLTLEQIGSSRPAPWSSGSCRPHARKAEVKALRDRRITSFAMELDAAHLARAVDGRAVLPGRHRGLQGRADRREPPAEVLPDAHDRGRHHPARRRCW